jgi:hypothetical protein
VWKEAVAGYFNQPTRIRVEGLNIVTEKAVQGSRPPDRNSNLRSGYDAGLLNIHKKRVGKVAERVCIWEHYGA